MAGVTSDPRRAGNVRPEARDLPVQRIHAQQSWRTEVTGIGSYRRLRLLAACVALALAFRVSGPASAAGPWSLGETASADSAATCVEESGDGARVVPCKGSAGATSSARLAACPAYGFDWLGPVDLSCTTYDCTVTAHIYPAQPEGTIYVVKLVTAADRCAAGTESTSTSTSLTHSFTGLAKNSVYLVSATAQGCPTPNGGVVRDTLTTAPAGGTLSLQASGSDGVLVTMNIPDSLGSTMIQRAPAGGAFTDVFVGYEKVYCQGIATYTNTGLQPGTHRYRLRRTGGEGVGRAVAYSPEATITVGSTCPTPGAPSFPVSSASLVGPVVRGLVVTALGADGRDLRPGDLAVERLLDARVEPDPGSRRRRHHARGQRDGLPALRAGEGCRHLRFDWPVLAPADADGDGGNRELRRHPGRPLPDHRPGERGALGQHRLPQRRSAGRPAHLLVRGRVVHGLPDDSRPWAGGLGSRDPRRRGSGGAVRLL